jgi:hypothetical protein
MSLGVVYIIGGIVSVLLYFCALGVLIFVDEDYFRELYDSDIWGDVILAFFMSWGFVAMVIGMLIVTIIQYVRWRRALHED